MSSEATNRAVIQPGGKLELVLPNFSDGDVVLVKTSSRPDRVDVVVERDDSHDGNGALPKREFGFARGQIKIHDDFDKPLPGFEEYS